MAKRYSSIHTTSCRISDIMVEDDYGLWMLHTDCTELETRLADMTKERDKWRRIRTPTHGTCCTCQACGVGYDDCRCDLDDVADDLVRMTKERDDYKDRCDALTVIEQFAATKEGRKELEIARAELAEEERDEAVKLKCCNNEWALAKCKKAREQFFGN